MIVKTMTVAEVARSKGVTETAVRYALNDPNNPLQAIKTGNRLIVLADSVESYTPRTYKHLEELKELATTHQDWILGFMPNIAAEIVADHPVAARAILHCFPGDTVRKKGTTFLWVGIALDAVDDIRFVECREAPLCLLGLTDSKETIKSKVKEWAIELVKEGFIVAN